MTSINQQLEKEVFDLIGNSSSSDSAVSVNALEAACLILDHKFGKDFHKKNPKLTVRYADIILKNIRMNDLKSAIQQNIGQNLDALRIAIKNKEFSVKGTFVDDFADSFRF